MAQLSWEEKIKRIELAPEDAQIMVAKAFIREDIDDEDIQYTFNTDSLEDLVGEGEVENIDNEENIMAVSSGSIGNFTIRVTKPKAGNKNYIRVASGGWSPCIKGKPTDAGCDVLANCVGYANGRFNEIYNEIKKVDGCKYPISTNAENFIEVAKKYGLKTGSEPKPGAIICWRKGDTLSGKDGAGHVEVVERVNPDGTIYTSSSGWNARAIYWNTTRSNKNGKWGAGKDYHFRAFIYNPAVEEEPLPDITPTVIRDIYVDQLETLKEMNVRTDIETTSPSLGMVPAGNIYNYYEAKKGKSSIWYAITPDKSQWIAGTNYNGTKYCEIYPAQPKPTPTPTPTTDLKVGDKVKIIGTGNGSSYGDSNTAYGIGWTRQILKIWNGRPYPYQVGNNTGTTGYYQAEALKKL